MEEDNLYKEDIVYKTLVDNYVKASIDYEKDKLKNKEANMNKVGQSINALSKYTDQLIRNNFIELFKNINLTSDDIADLMIKGIINKQTFENILIFKGIIKK